ncbi:hypothetical protein D3C79_984730 [compost metagenome]
MIYLLNIVQILQSINQFLKLCLGIRWKSQIVLWKHRQLRNRKFSNSYILECLLHRMELVRICIDHNRLVLFQDVLNIYICF